MQYIERKTEIATLRFVAIHFVLYFEVIDACKISVDFLI